LLLCVLPVTTPDLSCILTAVEAKALIGDITPKALQVVQEGDPTINGATIEEDRAAEDSDRMKVSSWNHAGEITQFALCSFLLTLCSLLFTLCTFL
jgi:hypothetical protein